MRKELYNVLCEKLGEIAEIKHIDLWNQNVEYIEQETTWARPAVFVEFCPIQWKAIAYGVEYRAEPLVKLHVVTDWTGSADAASELKDESLKVFDLLRSIHEKLTCTDGDTFLQLDLVESDTNHNHEEILENVEVYQCVAIRRLEE